MEPVRAVKDCVKIKIRSIRFRNRGMRAVIYNIRRSHRSPCFKVIDAESLSASRDMRGVYVIFSKRRNRAFSDWIVRNLGYEGSLMSVIRQRNRDIRLAAPIVNVKCIRLNKLLITGCGKS